MNHVDYFKSAFMALSLTAMLLVSGCKSIELNSSWRDRDIQIDGMQFDWENALFNLSDEKVNIGIINDEDYLYVCLVPLDETVIRQAMMMGFSVWIESKRNKDSIFGIRHPIGAKDIGFPMRDPDQDSQERWNMIEESLRKIQIMKPDDKDTVDILLENVSGLEVRVGTRNERMVYELKIPLAKSENHPYAVGALPGDEINIKFETGKSEMPERKRPGSMGGRPEGGTGNPGGGTPPGGGRGGMRPGGRGRPEMPQPLKLELKVKLAEPVA